MATHSSTLARRILWTEEPGGLQFMGSQRVEVLRRKCLRTHACIPKICPGFSFGLFIVKM